jgi:hypothetical protein
MKKKIKTVLARLKLRCGALRFNPARLWALERPSRVKMNAAAAAPLTAFPARCPRLSFFPLDSTFAVIDRMTDAYSVVLPGVDICKT